MGLACSILTSVVLTLAASALAGIERVKGLHCSANDENFIITFDHQEQRAIVSQKNGAKSYRYEQHDIFQTWRLVDEDGRQSYVLREGDTINGDFGWYFVASQVDPAGNIQVTTTGECSISD